MRNFIALVALLIYSTSIYSWFFDHKSSACLNKPTGSYGVGYRQLHLVNTTACPNVFLRTSNKGTLSLGNTSYCNEIELAVYYPSNQYGYNHYKSIHSIVEDVKAFNKKVPDEDIKLIKKIKTYAGYNLKLVDGRFPLIIFSPGYGVPVQEYENTITDLVSHGYIVVGINSQFINGNLNMNDSRMSRTIEPKTAEDKKNLFRNTYADLSFVYRYLKQNTNQEPVFKRINWQKVGLLGHSLGAAAVARFSYQPGISAVAAEDLTIDLVQGNQCHLDLKKPFLHLFSMQLYRQIRNQSVPYLCKKNIGSPYKKVVVVGEGQDVNISLHMNFTDYSTLQYYPPIKNAMEIFVENNPDELILGTGNGYNITSQINRELNRFFAAHLK
ncbi:MAG: hypothetical protein JJT82_08525 [Legionellaceae bacterium]|nr:hypothetical protein [Legionellaceae bacterium]